MKLVRLVLVTLCAAAGLVVFTQVPAVACSCAVADTAQYVDDADVIFVGTLAGIEQTSPGGDEVISSGDPVRYTFDVDRTLKGSPGDGVVASARDSASCGLSGMRLDESYVVFAGDEDGALGASLCGGTSLATQALLVGGVDAALALPRTPTATDLPAPVQPVPTQVPSGVEPASAGDGPPAWAWFGGVLLLALGVGVGAHSLRHEMR